MRSTGAVGPGSMRSHASQLPERPLVSATWAPAGAGAWIYPEHRDIAVAAVARLPPADREALGRLWAEARQGHEARLCEKPSEGEQGLAKKEVAIAVSEVERGEDNIIYLKIDKASIEQLPSLPLKRPWKEVYATDLELMVWIYEGSDQAEKALEQAQALGRQYAIELLNATVLEKDKQGEMHIHEEKQVHSRGRIALGIALGGLAGLVIGPVALVAGAIGGAVAGKKSAKKVEVGFSEAKLRRLNECFAPGGSALILVVEHRWFNTLQVEMAGTGGQLIHERLSDVSYEDVLKKLDAEEKASE